MKNKRQTRFEKKRNKKKTHNSSTKSKFVEKFNDRVKVAKNVARAERKFCDLFEVNWKVAPSVYFNYPQNFF